MCSFKRRPIMLRINVLNTVEREAFGIAPGFHQHADSNRKPDAATSAAIVYVLALLI
jgi:hypothetical protein